MSLVITGAGGTLGKKIVAALERRGTDFAVVTRSPGTAGSARTITVPGGYDDSDALQRAFAGAARVFLMSTPDLPEVRIRRHRNAIDAAVKAGVAHVVFLSLRDAVPESPFPFAAANYDAEAYLKATSSAWTILSPNIYAEAIAAQAGRTIAATGVLDLPFGDGRAGYVTRDDIAEVVAAVCAGAGHNGQRYEITGPQAPSGAEIAAMLSDILDRTITYRPQSEDQYVATLLAMGLPEVTARAFLGLCTAIAQQRFDLVTSTVLDLTGAEPTSLADHLRANAAAFG